MESRENRDISQELNKENYKEDARLLEKTKEKMVEMGLFDKDFIDGLDFVFVDTIEKNGKHQEAEFYLSEDGLTSPYNNENSDRSKVVGIITKSYLNKINEFYNIDNLEQFREIKNEKNISQHVWEKNLDKSIFLSFDAATVHEIAHAKSYNAIDKERKSFFDEEKFKNLIVDLTKTDPVFSKNESVDLSKFDYSDENWSELYALLYHREFLRREDNNNRNMIEEWDNHINEIASNLHGAVEKFNQEKGTDIKSEIIYKECHAFSFLLARIFEEKYKDFNERIKVLESCKKE